MRKVKKAGPYRSGFEKDVAGRIPCAFAYEGCCLEYDVRETRHYTPDFILWTQALLIECKGVFTSADRKKMLLVKEQYPDLDIRLLFQRDNKLSTRSKNRYSDWAKRHGFIYAVGQYIPQGWLAKKATVEEQARLKCYLKDTKEKDHEKIELAAKAR